MFWVVFFIHGIFNTKWYLFFVFSFLWLYYLIESMSRNLNKINQNEFEN